MVTPKVLKSKVKKKELAKDIVNSIAFKNFLSALHNPLTLIEYSRMFRYFIEFGRIKKIEQLLTGDNIKIEDRILEYIDYMKKKGITAITIKTRINPIKLFYEMNRKPLAWEMIKRTLPKPKALKDKSWERPQIQKMLTTAKIREQALILLLSSTGMRKGAVPLLNVGDLQLRQKYGIYEIIVYRGENEEYHTFTTPEARNKLDEYLDYRRRYGEEITPESPLFRTEWNLRNPETTNAPTRFTEKAIDEAMEALVFKAGLREKVDVGSFGNVMKGEAGRVRYEQKILHGFRKYFETTLLDAGFPENWVDMLEGHKLRGLRENYYRPKDDTVLVGTVSADGKRRMFGFVEVMQELMIDDAFRLRKQVQTLEADNERNNMLVQILAQEGILKPKHMKLLTAKAKMS
jgi:integrase/recombinase XerD